MSEVVSRRGVRGMGGAGVVGREDSDSEEDMVGGGGGGWGG